LPGKPQTRFGGRARESFQSWTYESDGYVTFDVVGTDPGDLARTWITLKASNTGAEDQFGHSVALAGDTLAVGAPGAASAATGVDGDQADDSAQGSGAIYVFRRTGTTWQQEAYFKASNTGAMDLFGTSVALAGDTLAVGAYF
jgi:hypothetical protein